MVQLISSVMNFLKSLFSWQTVGGNQPERKCAEDFRAEWLLSIALRRKKDMQHPENKPPYPKVVVFMPRFIERHQRFELSSFCIEAMGEDDAWNHLGEHCTKGLVRPLYGRADFVGRVCETATPALSLNPDWDPPRHVNILGWGEKSSHLSQAQVIVAAAQSHLNPQFSSL
jgi:hypothetical protein